MPLRTLGRIAVTTALASVATAELLPRQPLRKTSYLDAAPAHTHRLTVKFRDDLRVRADAGRLTASDPAAVSRIEAIARSHGATFRPLIDLPPAELDALTTRAATHSGRSQPDLAGMMVVSAAATSVVAVAEALHRSSDTEWVYFAELLPPPPCVDASPVTPTYVTMQGYRGPDPGVNMEAAWALGAMRGQGVRMADCEYGYNAKHEDLCNIVMEPNQTIAPEVIQFGWDEHGTSVFGEILSIDNEYGCTGLVPDVQGHFFTEWSVEEGSRRVKAITNAIATMGAGDVVVLEMQTTGSGGGYGPAELDPAVWTLCKLATDSGIVVVGAAGNGNQDLDADIYAEYRERGDSGAIIVGAGSADTQHKRLSFSTYGERVNVQGWGAAVFTLGYGTYAQHGGDKNQRYTNGFNGTSSATPIVSSCVIALQSLARERLGEPLAPWRIRQILVDTGVPQGDGGKIGPLPEMVRAASQVPLLADCDCDAKIDFADINPFVLALSDPNQYKQLYPWCPILNADCNSDGQVNFGDINPFVERLGG